MAHLRPPSASHERYCLACQIVQILCVCLSSSPVCVCMCVGGCMRAQVSQSTCVSVYAFKSACLNVFYVCRCLSVATQDPYFSPASVQIHLRVRVRTCINMIFHLPFHHTNKHNNPTHFVGYTFPSHFVIFF
jgi:hypothetical protein